MADVPQSGARQLKAGSAHALGNRGNTVHATPCARVLFINSCAHAFLPQILVPQILGAGGRVVFVCASYKPSCSEDLRGLALWCLVLNIPTDVAYCALAIPRISRYLRYLFRSAHRAYARVGTLSHR